MKKLFTIIVIILSIFVAYALGYNNAIVKATTSIGFVDEDASQFVLDIDGNYYAWDI